VAWLPVDLFLGIEYLNEFDEKFSKKNCMTPIIDAVTVIASFLGGKLEKGKWTPMKSNMRPRGGFGDRN
jgi:hypothetical protein